MTIDWTEVIIGICGILITGVLVPWIDTKRKEAKLRLTKEQQEEIDYWTEIGVRWAKQWLKSETGEKKKAEVMVFASDKLHELGIDVSAADLAIIIEAIYEKVKKESTETATV